ncbi:hypothetical protein A2886_03510 [candidate division WWE3 bacterium RIFCSPHIGHO2_01_FULL_42_13]|uniref:Peptidase M23 domain-containing protein n=1 Tax=candidate division WWE3 bacterium RIFCSPHIGHO2_01_FULL_42_13 TaxID=1802617 RepID=A0A1F4UR82_UNCKA|nr:MAG: hypothetical protein A2886_03510 [candidate division WWE3 bacterium RIFCSPHIGHO2_01_FULL_42_13]
MNPYHLLGYSGFSYTYPVRPRKGEKIRFWQNSGVSHVGRDKHAQDIIIPDPQERPLTIWVPQSGVIVGLAQNSTQWGETERFAPFMNFIRVYVGDKEFYFIAHIRAHSCEFSIGDKVTKGAKLALTGANGWMTDVRHVHFMVGRFGRNLSYKSLKVRWDWKQSYAPAK